MKTLLLGKNGQVGWELQRSLAPLGELIGYGSAQLDITDREALRKVVREARPDMIVNAAAYTAVDKAESEPDRAQRVNADAVETLAEEAARLGAWLVHYSTDYVFDGTKQGPYFEDDATRPLSVYGKTKLDGEQAIRARHDLHLIFRTSWVYAARGGNFPKTMLRLARERPGLKIVADQHGAPTSAELLADITALALHQVRSASNDSHPLAGTYHVVAAGETTWYDYARYVLELAMQQGAMLKCAPGNVGPIATEDYPTAARRPKNSRMNTDKLHKTFGIQPPDWRFHVSRLMDELCSQGAI